MSGLPGCGKSTWIYNVIKNKIVTDPIIISRDNVVDDISQAQNLTYNEVFKLCPDLIDILFKRQLNNITTERDIIWDQTNLTKKVRARNLKQIIELDKFRKICVQFNSTPFEMMTARLNRPGKTIPELVYNDMILRYEIAQIDEGFDEIWNIGTITGTLMKKQHKVTI